MDIAFLCNAANKLEKCKKNREILFRTNVDSFVIHFWINGEWEKTLLFTWLLDVVSIVLRHLWERKC